MKNVTAIKWFSQFFLSSLFILIAARYLVPGGSKGMILRAIFIVVPLGATAGIVLGDIPLYRGCKFSVVSLIVAFFFSCGRGFLMASSQ